jgi:hypothetical protein
MEQRLFVVPAKTARHIRWLYHHQGASMNALQRAYGIDRRTLLEILKLEEDTHEQQPTA